MVQVSAMTLPDDDREIPSRGITGELFVESVPLGLHYLVDGQFFDPDTVKVIDPSVDQSGAYDWVLTPTFLYGGKAIFSVINDKGDRFTFLVRYQKASNGFGESWLVRVHHGNGKPVYLGKMSRRSDGAYLIETKQSANSPELCREVFRLSLRVIRGESRLPQGYSIVHCGKCPRCGRRIKPEESNRSMICPQCAERLP
jgi:hypothetical protein